MIRLGAAVIAALVVFCGSAQAGEALVFVERPGCAWCKAWMKEVGTVYDKTEEGRRLPLRRVDLSHGLPPDLRHLKALVYTPTFVILSCGREAGRITGYPGEAHFYGLLGQAIARLDGQKPASC